MNGCNKHQSDQTDNSISIAFSINPRKSKGKFFVPSIRGNYDLEKQQVSACVHLPNNQNTKRSYHNTSNIKYYPDYAKAGTTVPMSVLQRSLKKKLL
ncbi:hypothetical protein CEXT_725161 [Caerostris extrusa]|uniref:Uncharacterized protein n=1 Tax=Caerostris extrusa TaxID=172846 RepID=A0AAV4NN33_CAEEX|nr:hypothetical protein CEXT_725161 [Caerostris extrusa]